MGMQTVELHTIGRKSGQHRAVLLTARSTTTSAPWSSPQGRRRPEPGVVPEPRGQPGGRAHDRGRYHEDDARLRPKQRRPRCGPPSSPRTRATPATSRRRRGHTRRHLRTRRVDTPLARALRGTAVAAVCVAAGAAIRELRDGEHEVTRVGIEVAVGTRVEGEPMRGEDRARRGWSSASRDECGRRAARRAFGLTTTSERRETVHGRAARGAEAVRRR